MKIYIKGENLIFDGECEIIKSPGYYNLIPIRVSEELQEMFTEIEFKNFIIDTTEEVS